MNFREALAGADFRVIVAKSKEHPSAAVVYTPHGNDDEQQWFLGILGPPTSINPDPLEMIWEFGDRPPKRGKLRAVDVSVRKPDTSEG